MHGQLLFREGFVCAARRRHPAFGRTLDPAAYLDQSHLQVSPRGEPAGYVDAVPGRAGHRRRVVLTVAQFLPAPSIVAATDLVATEPARLLRPEARRHGLLLQPHRPQSRISVPARDIS